jgi:anti-anti-sigma regulatory factor
MRREHLDTSALQILLALDREQRQRGGQLRLENPSASLRRWFDYAGAGALLGSTAPTGDRVSASGEDA